jgi:ABC-type amino acid transport substrate-binding protein
MVRHMTRLVIGSAALFVAAGAWCQSGRSDLATVKARGKLIMLCYPSQDSRNVSVNLERGPMRRIGTKQDFLGLDVDLMAAFAEQLGVKLEIRPVRAASFDELIPALVAGEGDVIASSFSITPSRQQVIDFSTPYQSVAELVVARRDLSLGGEKDLVRLVAVVIPGSSQEERLRLLGVKKLQYVEFARDELAAVAEGKADFTIVEANADMNVVQEFPNLQKAFAFSGVSAYAVAVRKGSDLRPLLNDWLDGLKASRQLEALVERWMPRRP